MNYVEYIKALYYESKNSYNYIKDLTTEEEIYKEIVDTYINSILIITQVVAYTSNDKMLKQHWEYVLKLLLKRCILENVKPKLSKLENGYGFTINEYRNNEQLILQFLETYLICQTPQRDIEYWIELGELLQLVKFEK